MEESEHTLKEHPITEESAKGGGESLQTEEKSSEANLEVIVPYGERSRVEETTH